MKAAHVDLKAAPSRLHYRATCQPVLDFHEEEDLLNKRMRIFNYVFGKKMKVMKFHCKSVKTTLHLGECPLIKPIFC